MKKILIPLIAISLSQVALSQQKWSSFPVESTFAGGDWLMMLDATGPSNKRATFTSLADWFLGTAGADNLLVSQGAITDPALGISTTVTWNDAADLFTAWKLNVTNTASAANSLLLDLQVGGVTAFSVDKDGDIVGTSFSGTVDITTDTAPALGGNLAVNANELQSTSNIVIQLGDNAGANKFSIQDSASAEVASIDSDGDFTVANLFTDRADYNEQASISNPAAGDGSIYLDSDDNTFKAIVADEGNTLQTLLTDQSAFAAFFTFTDEDASPAVVGRLKYDNTITGLNDGSLVWYDGDEVRSLVDINGSDGAGTAIAAGDDGYVVKFNWNAGDGYFSLEPDSTGSGSLGTNLSSSTDDLLSNNGTILFGGTGGTNNETLDFDFETVANTVAITTATGVTDIDFGTLQIVDDASNVANDIIDSQHYAAGSVDGEHLSADARGQFSEVLSAGHTLSISESTNEGYGSIHYVDTAVTIVLPAVADGASFTIVTIGAVAVSVDPDANDGIRMDGGAFAADGVTITNSSTAGDTVVLTYYNATGWHATTDGNWTSP